MEKLSQDFPLEQPRTREFQTAVTTRLEKGSIQKIIDARKGKHGAGMNELLIAAFSMAMKHVFGTESVSYLLEGHGREDFDERIDVSRTVGWFTSFYPVLKYLSGEELPFAPQVLVNYLGEFQDADGDRTGVRMIEHTAGKWDMSKDSPVMAPISLTGAMHASTLLLTVEYDNREYKKETMQKLADELSRELLHLAEKLNGAGPLPELPSDFGLHAVADKEWKAIQSLAQQKGAGKIKDLAERIYPVIERFSFVSAADIQKAAHLKHPAFRYFMTFQNTPAAQEDHGIYELFSYNRSRNEFSIFIQMDEKIEISVSYDRDLFSETWVNHFMEEFQQSLKYLKEV